MPQYLIMCRSLTYAQRASRELEHEGVSAVVTRAPQSISGEGCAYCIKVSERRLRDALRTLNGANLITGKVYAIGQGGAVSEVKI